MGEIYRATDETLGRAVAIKLLSERFADDPAVRGRFTREALAAARLSGDANTVTIFDVGEWNDRPFIVMEYLSGGSLEQQLAAEGAQSPRAVVAWIGQAARALDAAHEKGVVHRDVKPGNLLLDADGNVSVADFGIATAAGLDSLTQTGTVLGTAGYLSPEQAQGERATAASDVYALGVVAFELLAGRRPFESDSATAEAAAHVHAPIPSVREARPGLPAEVDRVFERVLAKEPGDRYASGGEFAEALGRALARPAGRTGAAAAPTVPLRRPRSPSHGGRSRMLPLAAGLLLLLGAGGAALAALLDEDGQGTGVTTLVRTVTGPNQTVRETVTAAAPEPPPPPPPAPTPPPAPAAGGAQLNDEGFAKMQAGDYQGALPLLEQAVAELQGTGELVEAYALYNLAFTRFALGRCDGVLEMLDRSESIQGKRKEITSLRRDARRRC
jgi:serine/threonine-protein kinase